MHHRRFLIDFRFTRVIYNLAKRHHAPIAHYFGSDAGMRLMNLDGRIALNILFYFVEQGVPCLGVHDSFIVPRRFEDELRNVMERFYKRYLGYPPKIDS